MSKLFLLRHLKSQWNLDKEFAGWVDNPLSREGILAAKEIAEKIEKVCADGGLSIDVVYTSPLIRNMDTVVRIFEYFPDKYPLFIHLDGGRMSRWGAHQGSSGQILFASGQKRGNFTDLNDNDIPSYVSENLNERYYGRLQGLNKDEIIKQYGEEKVHLWRRGYADKPPGGESLKYVYKRAAPFFKKYVERDLIRGKNVLLVASHNSLRAIVKYIENISDKDIPNLEIQFGELRSYEFNGKDYIKK
ncbi:MAG: histidine phosphatase family protein [Patescibacteria group bacterium]